ncbi:MAG: 50S ribosomal protein L23 [Patescibacteria group bacterium]
MTTQATSNRVIISPRITEKAALAGSNNCFVFIVDPRATKNEIAKEISELYNVDPIRINIARNAPKKRFFRGVWGKKPGVKKAYVYLKEGEKINVM